MSSAWARVEADDGQAELARLRRRVRELEARQAAGSGARRLDEDRFVDALSALSEGIALYDDCERLVICNDVYRALHPAVADLLTPGVTFETVLRGAVGRGQHPEALGREEDWIGERLHAFRHPGQAIEQRTADGRWLKVYEQKTADDCTVAVRIDITELKTREAELLATQSRLRAYLDAASDWAWEMDGSLRYTYLSEQFEALTGYSPHLSLGKTRDESPKLGRTASEKRRTDIVLGRRKDFRDHRLEVRRTNGQSAVLSISGNALHDDDGAFIGYRGVGRDITEQVHALEAEHEARNRLVNAIQGLTEALALWDGEGRLVICNEEFRRINGPVADLLQPGLEFEPFLRTSVARGLFPDAAGREADFIAERLERRRNPGSRFEVRWHDDSWRLAHEQPLPDGSLVTISIDITERKWIEAELVASHEMLERRVERRTAEVRQSNAQLRAEIAERGRAEDALRNSRDQLRLAACRT